MSIVAVHGPNTFGSRGVAGSASSPLMGTANPTNGLIWDFKLDQPTTRLNADFAWTFPPNGTPTPQNVADPAAVTYATGGSKTVQCIVTGAGTGASPYPPAGTYTLTITAVTGAGTSPLLAGDQDEDQDEVQDKDQEEVQDEEFDPGDYTVDEVKEYVDANPDSAREILDAEIAGKNRSTLVTYLESVVPYDPADYTVEDVTTYAQANHDQAQDLYDAEVAGRNRSTLLAALEAIIESQTAGP